MYRIQNRFKIAGVAAHVVAPEENVDQDGRGEHEELQPEHGDLAARGSSEFGAVQNYFNVADLEIDDNGLYKLNNKEKLNEIIEHFYKL